MVPALEHDLSGAQLCGLAASATDFCAVSDPTLSVTGRPIEGTELARRRTDVRVVDIPIDEVGGDVRRGTEALTPGSISLPCQVVERPRSEGIEGFLGRQAIGWRHGGLRISNRHAA
jgi:hypothetical protein